MRDTVRAPLAVKTNPARPSLQVFVSALAIATKHTHLLHATQDFLHGSHPKRATTLYSPRPRALFCWLNRQTELAICRKHRRRRLHGGRCCPAALPTIPMVFVDVVHLNGLTKSYKKPSRARFFSSDASPHVPCLFSTLNRKLALVSSPCITSACMLRSPPLQPHSSRPAPIC